MASSPFSYGMSNFTSQFSSSIPSSNLNTSIRLGGMAPPHTTFSFGDSHIPQMTPAVGGLPPFNPGSNPGPNALRRSGQPHGQVVAYGPSFTPTTSAPIMTNTFGMTNPPLSSGFSPGGGRFHTLGNPQPGATPVGGNFYNPHHNIRTSMMPNQPFMNHFGGGSYNPRQGYGAYQNPVWVVIPQQQYFLRSWGQIVRKTGPRSNQIKQMQKQNTEDTQYKRDTDLRGSPSVGYVHQRNCQVLPLLLSSK
jgi:hypothetical protein